MNRIALLYHPHKETAIQLTTLWKDEIITRGAPAPLVASAWDEQSIMDVCGQVDLVVTLGGDGTLLRGVRIASKCGVPSLGVKLGHVGFLSEFAPNEFVPNLDRLISGQFWVEKRMMVRTFLRRGNVVGGDYEAVNDVVVSRGNLARVERIEVFIDGQHLANFALDGVIVATATGSTAYSLAAGGPILAPTVRTLLLTLIAPYLSPIRSLVLPEGSRVAVRVTSPLPAILTIDGQYDVELQKDDVVETEASPHIALFARLEEPTYFYRTLLDRLRANGD